MAPNKLDDFFRNTIEKSTTHYSEKAPRTKEDVWKELLKESDQKTFQRKKLFLAASVILLLILSSVQFYSLNQKNKLISELSNQITTLQIENKSNLVALQSIQPEIKTITKTETRVIEKVVPVKEIVKVVEHVTDTIIIIPETKTHEIDQLARIENMDEVKIEAPEAKVVHTDAPVEFILTENNETTKTRKSLETMLIGYAKSKARKQANTSSSSLQASLKQFMSVN